MFEKWQGGLSRLFRVRAATSHDDNPFIPNHIRQNLMSGTALQTAAQSFRAAWHLAKPYFWSSEERWKARLMLGVVVGLTLGQVALSVEFNQWYGEFYKALQNKDQPGFDSSVLKFCAIAGTYIAVAVTDFYLSQRLQLNWRKWMTDKYSKMWLRDKTFHRLQSIYGRTDNPDQRIADDIGLFTNNTLNLSTGLLKNCVSLPAFSIILWNLSSGMKFNVAGQDLTIPGFLFWLALGYAAAGTWISHKIGKSLVSLDYNQQKLEADYRVALVQVRKNAENIAMSGGEDVEQDLLDGKFDKAMVNLGRIIDKRKQLTGFTATYNQASVIVPYALAAPSYFAGKADLGQLMQIGQGFGNVQESMSFFVNSYATLAAWKATANRLTEFTYAMEQSSQDYARGFAAPGPTVS